MFPSRYPGVCVVCNAHLPAAQLMCFKADGAWKVVCHTHRDQVARPAVKIGYVEDLRSHRVPHIQGPHVTVSQVNLSSEQFGGYMTLVRSGQWLPDLGVSAFPASGAVFEVLRALNESGLPLVVEPGVKALLAAEQAAEQAALAAIGDERLFPFQRIGAAWLRSRTRALLADDMGLGKTCQLLTSIEDAPPLLIVCPSVAKGVWARELRKWRCDNWRVSILSGRGSFRWPEPGECVITNYDVLSSDPAQAHPWTVLVCDEAHALKEPKTARHQRTAALAAQAARCYLLTATPLLNRPQELWNLLKLAGLEREAYGTFAAFCHAFDGHPSRGWGTPRATAALGFSRVALRRVKTEVLDQLPPKRRAMVPVPVTISRGDQVILDEAEAALLQYGSSVPFEHISRARAITARAKIPALLDRVEEFEAASEPLVVFSCHREPVETLAARPGWAIITGDTSPERRTSIEEQFQAGLLRGVAATVQAGGVAITLTRAAHVLFVDRAWTPALNEQAEDRCNRIGQTRGVLVEVLAAAKTLDERVEEIIEAKSAIIAASVDRASIVRVDASIFDDAPEQVEQPAPAPAPVAAPTPLAWEIDCPF